MGTIPKGTNPLHTPQYRRLRKQIRAWREGAGLSQRELGRKLRKPHSYVNKCEAGDRRLDPIEFVNWCRACGVRPTDGISEIEG